MPWQAGRDNQTEFDFAEYVRRMMERNGQGSRVEMTPRDLEALAAEANTLPVVPQREAYVPDWLSDSHADLRRFETDQLYDALLNEADQGWSEQEANEARHRYDYLTGGTPIEFVPHYGGERLTSWDLDGEDANDPDHRYMYDEDYRGDLTRAEAGGTIDPNQARELMQMRVVDAGGSVSKMSPRQIWHSQVGGGTRNNTFTANGKQYRYSYDDMQKYGDIGSATGMSITDYLKTKGLKAPPPRETLINDASGATVGRRAWDPKLDLRPGEENKWDLSAFPGYGQQPAAAAPSTSAQSAQPSAWLQRRGGTAPSAATNVQRGTTSAATSSPAQPVRKKIHGTNVTSKISDEEHMRRVIKRYGRKR